MADERLANVETKVDHLEIRFDRLETKVDQLVSGLADTRTEMRVLFEASQASIRTVADGLISLEETTQRGFNELRTQMIEIVAPIAATVQHHTRVLGDHEQRLRAVEEP